MQSNTSALRSTLTAFRRQVLVAGALVATCGLVACGSDSKKSTTTTAGTTTAGTTTAGNPTGDSTTSGSTTSGGSTATACTIPNCDHTGNEPTFTPMSAGVMATPTGGTAVAMKYVRFQNSNTNTGTNKQFELAGLDYDPCVFTWNHDQTSTGVENYSLFPTANFNFFGVYLVNGTPGTALAAGTYTVGAASGKQVIISGTPNPSGTGYGVVNCHATAYEAITSGTIIIDSVSTAGAPVSGTFNLTTTNDATAAVGGTISGAFQVGACGSSSGTQPVAPSPDVNACATLN